MKPTRQQLIRRLAAAKAISENTKRVRGRVYGPDGKIDTLGVLIKVARKQGYTGPETYYNDNLKEKADFLINKQVWAWFGWEKNPDITISPGVTKSLLFLNDIDNYTSTQIGKFIASETRDLLKKGQQNATPNKRTTPTPH